MKNLKKTHRLSIRITATEYVIVQSRSKKCSLKLSTYIRQAIITSKIQPILDEKQKEILLSLIGLSRNFNQCVKHLNQTKEFPQHAIEIQKTINEVNHIINNFKNLKK
jgi:hypothetical protein